MLLRICLYLFLLFLPANYTTTRSSSPLIPADPAAAMSSVCRQLYADMQLDSMVDYTAFEQAITGAQAIERRCCRESSNVSSTEVDSIGRIGRYL